MPTIESPARQQFGRDAIGFSENVYARDHEFGFGARARYPDMPVVIFFGGAGEEQAPDQ